MKNVTFLNNLKSHFLELAGTEDVTVTGCTFRDIGRNMKAADMEMHSAGCMFGYIFQDISL